eukprot:9765223-Ditylum_brightwellii.AAC.1
MSAIHSVTHVARWAANSEAAYLYKDVTGRTGIALWLLSILVAVPMLYCKWYDITCLERAPSAGPMCHMHSCLPSCTASIAETTTLGECAG